MAEYIGLLFFLTFVFVMISLRNMKYHSDWGGKNLTPPIRMLVFMILVFWFIGATLDEFASEETYIRLELLLVILPMLFYFVDYYTYKENKEDKAFAEKTVKGALTNHIVYIAITYFVFASGLFWKVRLTIAELFMTVDIILSSMFYVFYYSKYCEDEEYTERLLKYAKINQTAASIAMAVIFWYKYIFLMK